MEKYRVIPVSKLVEPRNPVRTGFDEDAMLELARSIRDNGILQPLRVTPLEDGTFEVRVGHRRLLAARMVGRLEAPCVVVDGAGQVDAERIAENADREDMSPVDEARYYKRLFLDNGQDVDRVCSIVKRTRARVEGRMLLLEGDPAVFAALEAGQITLGVAEELNAFKREAGRRFHLDFAIRCGATRAQVRDWRARDNAAAEQAASVAPSLATADAPASSSPIAPPPETPYAAMAPPWSISQSLEPRPCVFCQAVHPEWRMFRVFVCAIDADKYLAPLQAAPKV